MHYGNLTIRLKHLRTVNGKIQTTTSQAKAMFEDLNQKLKAAGFEPLPHHVAEMKYYDTCIPHAVAKQQLQNDPSKSTRETGLNRVSRTSLKSWVEVLKR